MFLARVLLTILTIVTTIRIMRHGRHDTDHYIPGIGR